VTWILIAAALAAVAWAVAGQLDAPSWLKATVAGFAAAAAGIGKLLERREGDAVARRARERTLHQHLRFWDSPRGRLRRLGEIDRRSLGVDARAIEPLGGPATEDTYVPRPEDEAVCRAVREQAFTLVVGGSKVGKTRTAYEAARTTCPDHSVVVPEAAGSLLEILTVEPRLELGDALVWLDDLDAYLERGGGLTLNLLEALMGRDPPVKILATIATTEFDRHTASRGVSRPAHLVLARAATIFLQPLCDADAVRAALGPVSEQFVRNVARYGLGATLVAGPDLVRRFERGDSPVGVAIVRAAADWRRAGVPSPVPEAMLERLFLSYVEPGQPIGAHAFRAGLDWALFEIHAGTALLDRRSSQPAAYAATEYLVEHVESEAERIDDTVWQQALTLEGVDALLSVGLSAYARDRLDIAEAAFEAASAAGSAEAAYNLAAVLEDRGSTDDATAEPSTTGETAIEELGTVDHAVTVREELDTDHKTPFIEPLIWEIAHGVTAIRMFDELDLYTAPHFKQVLLDLISRGARRVIVDFTEVTFIDSTTLGVLVGAIKRLCAVDGALVLVSSDRNITKIFEIVGLDRVISIFSTLDEARNFFEAARAPGK
jgi:anti-anti-sigma factor